MTEFIEKIRRLVNGRPVEVFVTHGDEMRVRAYMDRVNAEQFKLDAFANNDGKPPYDLEAEGDFIIALDVLIEQGLRANEEANGLFGTYWGEILSREQVNELARRRRQAKDDAAS